jgi:hypothetical protein
VGNEDEKILGREEHEGARRKNQGTFILDQLACSATHSGDARIPLVLLFFASCAEESFLRGPSRLGKS